MNKETPRGFLYQPYEPTPDNPSEILTGISFCGVDYVGVEDYKKLQAKVNQLEINIEEAIEILKNFDVFKEFSFPLMKRDEENQVKSSIDYEFKTTLYKQLLSILERGKE